MRKLHCILLIDDDHPTNFWNHHLLATRGCAEQIVISKSGAEALRFLRQCMEPATDAPLPQWPDLIFLDINMPRMNGWEFLDNYLSLPPDGHQKTVIVLLTTSLFPEDLEKAEKMPEVAGLENKPLTPETLDKLWAAHFSDEQ